LPLVEQFGIDMQGACSRLRRAAFTSQSQGLGAEGGIVTATLGWLRAVFHDNRKIRPYSGQVYSTTSYFPCGLRLLARLLLALLPRVIAARRYAQYLAETTYRIAQAVLVDETVAAHWSGVCEKIAMAFFKISNSCACRRANARSWRNSAVVAGSSFALTVTATGVWAACCHL
jgi:hypothetical protein